MNFCQRKVNIFPRYSIHFSLLFVEQGVVLPGFCFTDKSDDTHKGNKQTLFLFATAASSHMLKYQICGLLFEMSTHIFDGSACNLETVTG